MSYSFVKELRRSKYRLLGLVGQGQFGRVYCAVHRKTGRLVALKELNRDRFSTHKFLRELRFLLSLQHENIVTCQAMEQTATGRYLVMDYCEGGTLRSLLEEEVQLHPIQGLNLIAQILAGLAHAHERGIVHCDIKPENILLTVTVHGWTAKISDFGIARLSQEIGSDDFTNTGSPAYMAPERFYGQYSIASDLYAVGVLLFETLTGYRPFSGVPAELMSAHLNQSVNIPAVVPAALQTVLQTALQKLPARRFRSAQAMLEALQTAIAIAGNALNQNWDTATLLRPSQPLPPVASQAEYQELLDTPIHQLVCGCLPPLATRPAAGGWPADQFFRVYDNRVGLQRYDQSGSHPLPPALRRQPPVAMPRVRLPQAIAQLIVQRDGCFAITQEAVYWLAATLFDSYFEPSTTYPAPASPQLVAALERRTQVAIAPGGRWMATTYPLSELDQQVLQIWNLRQGQHLKPMITVQAPPAFQLLIPDTHHLVVCSHLTDATSHASITSTQIALFTRRGTEAGCFKLPIPLRQLAVTPTPYRFLATEPNYPDSVLFLDIKPLRIQRIGLEMAPHLFAATTWGYALMSRLGQIRLLDAYGQLVGHIQGPPQPTALSFLAPHQLLVATWEDTQGYLFGINLRELELDLLF